MFPRHLTSLLAVATPALLSAAVADFNELTLAPESAYYGQDSAGAFTSAGLTLANSYTDFGGGFFGWEGFAVSNRTDTTTAGFGNQFSAYAGGGVTPAGTLSTGSSYALSYLSSPTRITLPSGLGSPSSVYLTNTTYAALSMINGDAFAKKFGGASGNDPDFLELTVTGLSPTQSVTGTLTFALADYRFSNNSLDYIVKDWTLLDLIALGNNVRFLDFSLNGSDVGQFGLNTPTYFALDRLTVVPEPSAYAFCAGLVVVISMVIARRRK